MEQSSEIIFLLANKIFDGWNNCSSFPMVLFPMQKKFFFLMILCLLGSKALFALDPVVEVSTPIISVSTAAVNVSTSTRNSFFDRQQFFISHAISGTMGWFDHFFTPKHEELEANQSFLRLIGTYQWINGQGFRFQPRFRLRLRVPGLQKRLSLIIAGEDENSDFKSQDINHVSPVIDPATNATVRSRSVGLQFLAYEWVKSRVDFDLNLRSELELEGTARYRRKMTFDDVTQARFTETGFWRQKVGFGETTQFDVDRQITPKTILSWDNEGTYSQKSHGLDWVTSLNYEIRTSPKSALSFQSLAVGVTRPHGVVTDYRFAPKYRESILRPWFFYEIEPALDFKRRDVAGWESIFSAAFRIEILYRNIQ